MQLDAICVCCGKPSRLSDAQVGKAVACPRCRHFQIFDPAPASRRPLTPIPPGTVLFVPPTPLSGANS
jgi:hypothetical protein